MDREQSSASSLLQEDVQDWVQDKILLQENRMLERGRLGESEVVEWEWYTRSYWANHGGERGGTVSTRAIGLWRSADTTGMEGMGLLDTSKSCGLGYSKGGTTTVTNTRSLSPTIPTLTLSG